MLTAKTLFFGISDVLTEISNTFAAIRGLFHDILTANVVFRRPIEWVQFISSKNLHAWVEMKMVVRWPKIWAQKIDGRNFQRLFLHLVCQGLLLVLRIIQRCLAHLKRRGRGLSFSCEIQCQDGSGSKYAIL